MTASRSPATAASGPAPAFDPVRTARELLSTASEGALATAGEEGFPFASLVQVATTAHGEPIILVSRLAQHTKNLLRDSRASLLLAAVAAEADPLAQPRLSVSGRVTTREIAPHHRARFLARNPDAAFYADFTDFGFHRIEVESSHLVAGFGRIVDLKPERLLPDFSGAEEVLEAEPSAVEHMNEDHAEAMNLYATVLLGKASGAWHTTGIDPDGIDLRSGRDRARLWFPERVTTAIGLRKMLADLAREARSKSSPPPLAGEAGEGASR